MAGPENIKTCDIIQTEQAVLIYLETHSDVTTVKEKEVVNLKEQGGGKVYGKVWREDRESRNELNCNLKQNKIKQN